MSFSGPKAFTQRQASTLFLRVPKDDWSAVKAGRKTEFRSSVGRVVEQMWSVKTPTPVVCYRVTKIHGHEHSLMVLEQMWREPLGAIQPESLQREGFDSFAEFRRYFMARERRHFTPTREIACYRVRPWQPGDAALLSAALLDRLYGEFGVLT